MTTTENNLNEHLSRTPQEQQNEENDENERLARINEMSPGVHGKKAVDQKTISLEL